MKKNYSNDIIKNDINKINENNPKIFQLSR